MSREEVIRKYTSGSSKSSDYLAGSIAPVSVAGVSAPGLSTTGLSFPSTTGLSFPSVAGLSMPSMSGLSMPSSGGEASSYWMQVLFYLTLYAFVVFIIGVFIHFSITPVFSFTPGGKGILSVPGATSDMVYWNTRVQPNPTIAVPGPTDVIGGYAFINSFSMCFDVLLTNITSASVGSNRLVLYKTAALPTTNTQIAAPSNQTMTDYMNLTVGASMIAYLANDTNDMVITFFCADKNGQNIQYSCAPVKNIPLNTPFRISLVVEKNSFTVYLNAMQVSQKIVSAGISLNPKNTSAGAQRFYAAPDWASQPTKTVYVQNLHIWPYAIQYPEVQAAQPALASPTDFTGKKAT
jgi:hypothetical protein